MIKILHHFLLKGFIPMKALFLFLIIGIIGVECGIYFVIPSELTGNSGENKREIFGVFFGIVPAYFIAWCFCVCKKTYAKENPEAQWSKISLVIFAFVFQVAWFIILSYFRNRVLFALSGLTACASFVLPILRIYEINIVEIKIFFLIVTGVIAGLIMWVSIEFIIYEKFITYAWIVAYYVYPIYLGVFAGLFVRFLRGGSALPPPT
jgi:hypothetical protein